MDSSELTECVCLCLPQDHAQPTLSAMALIANASMDIILFSLELALSALLEHIGMVKNALKETLHACLAINGTQLLEDVFWLSLSAIPTNTGMA